MNRQMNRFGERDDRGKQRPLTETEKRHILYFLANTEEGNLEIAVRRFHRDLQTIRKIADDAGLDMQKFK